MSYPWESILPNLLDRTLQHRLPLLKEPHDEAVRLFNGFTEGLPFLSADLYGQTLVLFAHKILNGEADTLIKFALEYYQTKLPFIKCVIAKQRSSTDTRLRQGEIVLGTTPDTSINEDGTGYALDLLMNQDAGFYLDTRGVRAWLKAHSAGKNVLNTFAYTGSLGVAALAGSAEHVTQIDRSAKFLSLAQESVRLNGLDPKRMTCKAVDFFVAVSQLKHSGQLFDTVILDPPFFSITERGRVDTVNEATRLVNKARPLVRDGGRLMVVNNALFLGGQEFITALEGLSHGGFVAIEEILPVPEDVTGYPETRIGRAPTDPAPFNHPTKIVVLKVGRKQEADMEVKKRI